MKMNKKTKKTLFQIILEFIPSLLTLLNLGCGFLSIIFLFNHEYVYSILILFGSFIFDFLDGFITRKFGWESDIGIELDSLADSVSFVIAPALIFYNLIQNNLFGLIVALFISFFGIYRLAKFNITRGEKCFIGMPTPIFTLLLLIYFLILTTNPELNFNGYISSIMILILAYLMVSPIRFPSLKEKKMVKIKIIGILFFLLLFLLLFFGMIILVVSLLFQVIFLASIIYLLVDKKITYNMEIVLYIITFILTSLFSDILFFNSTIMFFLPFIIMILFSPLIQKSLDLKKQ